MLPANFQPAYEKFFALLSWSHFATHLEIKMNAHDYDMSTVYLTFFSIAISGLHLRSSMDDYHVLFGKLLTICFQQKARFTMCKLTFKVAICEM